MVEEEEWKSQHDKVKLDKKDVRVEDVLVATCGDDGDVRVWRPLRVNLLLLPPATKLGQGYIFTGVCDSVHRGGLVWGGLLRGGSWWRPPPGTATAAGGTHPIGMRSCL